MQSKNIWFKNNWKCDDNAITKCLFYMLPLEFQGLNNYFICIHWSSKDEMAIVYSSFKIVGIEWLLYMFHQSKFQGLNGYYICIFWSSKTWIATVYVSFGVSRIEWLLYICFWNFNGQDLLRDVLKTFLCFNIWGTNLGRVLYSHLIEHKHYCQVSMWRIHVAMMMC